MIILVRNVSGFSRNRESSIIEIRASVIIQSIAQMLGPGSLGPVFEPLRFPIGEQSFKIDFDLRINLGSTNEYETVLVDCEPNSDGPWIFGSQIMLRFTNIHLPEVSFKI